MTKLRLPLFATRVLIALFLLPWVAMRFATPDSARGVADKYYGFGDAPEIVFTLLAIGWAVLLLTFAAGFAKRVSYGLVLVLHTIGTIATIPYLIPGTDDFNILFMAALPTIGAMWLLYLLRDHDTLLSLDALRRGRLRRSTQPAGSAGLS